MSVDRAIWSRRHQNCYRTGRLIAPGAEDKRRETRGNLEQNYLSGPKIPAHPLNAVTVMGAYLQFHGSIFGPT